MKVYLAQREYPYEGPTLIGVFSDPVKGRAACEEHWKDMNYDWPLQWLNSRAKADYFEYVIQEEEVK